MNKFSLLVAGDVYTQYYTLSHQFISWALHFIRWREAKP